MITGELYYVAPLNLRPLIRLIIILMVVTVAVTGISHAVVKHAQEALQVRDCLERGNGGLHIENWYRAEDEHYLQVCQFDNGEFGLRVSIREGGKPQEITAFILRQYKTLLELHRYMINSGATIIWPPIP
jgi:hypothetical protein